MGQTFTFFSLLYLVTSLVSFFGAFLSWQRRDIKGAVDVTYLMIASGIASLWLIFETAATTVSDKILFAKLEMTGGVMVPVFFFIFVLRFSSMDKYLTGKYIWGYLIIPLLTLALIFTNELHHLYWTGFSDISPTTNLIEYYHGPLFWIFYVIYSNILLAIATALLIKFIIIHRLSFRSHGLILLIGSVLPWISSFFYMSGVNIVPGLDLLPISMTFSGVVLIYSVLYTRFLDLIPVARETMVDLMPEGVMALDKKNRIQDINNKALDYLGITVKRVTGMQLDKSLSNNFILIDAVLSENISEQAEIPSNGKIKFYSVLKQPLKSQPGSRLILISDITDYILRQRMITAAEENYRKLYKMFTLMTDNMPDMIWAKDLDMNYIFTNRSVRDKMLSVNDKEEITGKNLKNFVKNRSTGEKPDEDYSDFISKDHNSDLIVLNSGKPVEYKDSWVKEGRVIYLDIRKAPIYNESGEMIGLVASGHDITREKNAESEVIRRDTLLDSIARATSILIQSEEVEITIPKVLELIGTATGSGSVRIYRNHYNDKDKRELFSMDYEWADNNNISRGGLPTLQNLSYEKLIPRWYSVFKSGGLISGVKSDFPEDEQKILDKLKIKSLLASPIFVENIFWGFIVYSNYIIEKKLLTSEVQILSAAANTIGFAIQRKYSRDELIKAKERAEESDRLKSAFLANISHEIRTPMNGILGFTDLLKEPLLSAEDKQQYIEIIEKSGKRMLNIINDLICISTLEAGFIRANISKVDVNEQLDFIYNFFRPQIEEKGLKLRIINNLKKDESWIMTDREKLYAILTNLTRNAVKFTNSGYIEVGCSKIENYLEFFVRDSGIGIPEEKREIIFERFIQGNDSLTSRYEGAGLGLAISKAYTELLGGTIRVESEEGKGSTFYFTVFNNPAE